MKKHLLVVAGLALTIACQPKEETTATPNSEVTQTEIQSEAEKSHADWDTFFSDFQAAVKAGDFNKLEAMSNGEVFSPQFVEDYYEYYFEGDAKERFLAVKSSDAKELDLNVEIIPGMESEESMKGLSDGKTISLYEASEDGEFESAIIYYFAKVNGEYKIVGTMMAG